MGLTIVQRIDGRLREGAPGGKSIGQRLQEDARAPLCPPKRLGTLLRPLDCRKSQRFKARPLIGTFKCPWKAGLPGLLFHDLRRSAVRNLERASVPRSVAMKLTGHKTESSYRRYAIVAETDLREAGVKLSASLDEAERSQRGSRP